MTHNIRAVRLSKWYGKVTALSDVSLHLESGIWGLLGPNGSGKTTFLRLAAGQLKPSLGEIRIDGSVPFANPGALRLVGLCPEADALYDALTGLEFVTFMARLSGFDKGEAKDRSTRILETLDLQTVQGRRIGTYSRGMRQRVKLAQALVHDPGVLLLDEPMNGTDPISRQIILREVRHRAEQGTLVLFSTHVLPEVEALTNRVLLIARGQLVAHGEVQEIRSLLDEHPHHIRVVCDRPRDLASAVLRMDGVVSLRFPSRDSVEFESSIPDSVYAALCDELVRGNYQVQAITSPDATLEALFHYLVERSHQRTPKLVAPQAISQVESA